MGRDCYFKQTVQVSFRAKVTLGQTTKEHMPKTLWTEEGRMYQAQGMVSTKDLKYENGWSV